MATPSSSATSPSPTMAFSPSLHLDPPPHDPLDTDDRKRAVEKFKARAEISNVTRSLRARLSYASYKAAHNISHVPLRELEAQTQSQAQVYSRTLAAKRKASVLASSPYHTGGSNNYYNNPATQGGASPAQNPVRRQGSMAPPVNFAFRTYYPASVNGQNAAAGGSGADAPRPMHAQSLFTSILAPPPSQPARTILNVADPPVPPSVRPPASPRPRSSKPSARSIAEGTRAMAKTRHSRDDRPEKRKPKSRHSLDKGKQKQRRREEVDADGDVDMKAAATLTSLLLNHRPSIGSAGSPRSSLDESETGSVHSYPGHFAQSSARGGPPPNSNAAASSSQQSMPEFRRASATPPPSQGRGQTTPRPAPTDNEAADLMLFLATSPSPVRNKEAGRDLAAFRALNGGGSARQRGRVLFPTAGSLADGDGAPRGSGLGGGLVRGGGAESFTSSVSSIGGEMRGSASGAASRTGTPVPAAAPTIASAQLLPPPPSPVPRAEPSPKPVYGQPPPPPPPPPTQAQAQPPQVAQSQPPPQQQPAAQSPHQPQPQQAQQGQGQGQPTFDFNDFLHASPSPRPASAGAGAGGSPLMSGGGAMQTQPQLQPQIQMQSQKNLGLRADVGRKLFEEEQMRQQALGGHAHGHAQMHGQMPMPMPMQSPGKARAAQEEQAQQQQQQRALGAGIDLVQS
ncbi:hypothetical protein B0H11DRAFT_2244575 [Mycena galericulata]|nr:hypothetical protein B0H11DRAFT_2244575 [Mycena galericulata]